MEMKLRKYIAIALACTGVLLTSCEKFLEQAPDMRTKIDEVEKVAQLVGSAYPNYNYLAMSEFYSDNIADKGPAIGHNDDPYQSYYFWEDVQGSGNNTPTQYWNGVYAAIAAANQALEAIEKENFGTSVNAYKGEALVARAYNHFMLASFFAQPYDNCDDISFIGPAYVERSSTVALAHYSREKVKDTNDRIRKDQKEGHPLSQGGYWNVPRNHFSFSSTHV